jgi:hypothetical protein
VSERRPRPELFAGAAADAGAGDGTPPDLEIEAEFAAAELRHLESPTTRMRVDGGGGVSREDERVRENLPEPAEPGRTYRDARIRRRLGARLSGPADVPGD